MHNILGIEWKVNVDLKPSWCAPYLAYHKSVAPIVYEGKLIGWRPFWRRWAIIYDFILGGLFHQLGLATAQTTSEVGMPGVRITSPISRACNLTLIACSKWSLVASKIKRLGTRLEKLNATPEQHRPQALTSRLWLGNVREMGLMGLMWAFTGLIYKSIEVL